mmetsp:Transcript_6602/g.7590  ORF Transcript_6602/g.7590 Transcript_6602/m.7590 type:complete len:265 (+) Transcript_6602:112-906(+)|eukprot:CAMPEP_0204647572 /NCGR_PEP_ID=MMETSP0718-20130828/6362_1 /ASSEMBLY_ACC=CAM_ASM_000674 /TAXON_ID=230516 /ORGANISM="Chaetoceros curvisetus" /LENGTH=264 /DNA_ID=CAMNT_0051670173 /DNA_START=98 /DNA_END=892 /DNA_ORIENTATION=-
MSGSAGVSDGVVKKTILSNISSMKVPHMRPNKLRKILCKVTNCTWTQYQNILDAMINDGTIETRMVEGEMVILSSGQVGVNSADADDTKASSSSDTELETITEEMTIPIEIILHLTRKGRKKQKNIETNSKTKITYDAETTKITKTKQPNGVKNGTLIITKTWDPNFIPPAKNDEPELDAKEAKKEAKKVAKKQFKAAKFFIQGMLKSYQENPEHFAPKKAGGTFAEQDEAKKMKEELSKKRRKKDKNIDTDASKKKKKKRKFY